MNSTEQWITFQSTSPVPSTKNLTHEILYRTPILFVGYCELFVFLLGSPMNILVLYLTVVLLRKNSGRSSNHHQSNLWFVVSMTSADTLFCCFHSSMMFLHYVFNVGYNAEACFFKYIITHSTSICSSLSLLALNIDKFLYLNGPLHYHRRVTSLRALIAVAATWIISVCWAVFFMLGPFSKYSAPCNFRPYRLHFYMIFAICFFVLPTVISLLISIYIASVVVRVSRENAIRKNSIRSAQRTNAKAIAFVFTTTLWSSITYLPYRFAYLVYISPAFANNATWSMTTAFYILFALMAVNGAGNPFITIITQRRYSVAASSVWNWVKSASKRKRQSRKASLSTMMTLQTYVSKFSLKKAGKEGMNKNGDEEAKVALKEKEDVECKM